MFKKVLLLLVAIIYSCTTLAFCIRPFKVGSEEWPPYQINKDDANYLGFDSDLLQVILKRFSCSIKFTSIPWNQQQESLSKGKIDMALGATPNEERQRYAYFSKPYRTEIVRMFVLAKNVDKYNINSIDDLKNLKILLGTEAGYYYGKAFEKLTRNIEFTRKIRIVANTKLNIERIIDHKIDAFLADQNVAQYYLNKFGYNEQIVALPLIVSEADVSIMVSKASGSSEFMNKLNEEIDSAINSQEYRDLEKKYWKGNIN